MAKETNVYDVVYRTTSGRAMVAKRIEAPTAEAAKAKVTKQMKASSTFQSVTMAIKIG